MLKYEKIAMDIENKINSGEYLLDSQLPLEKEMCEHYNVSRITIKKAMDKLVMRGLVVKRRGSGTFVKSIGAAEKLDTSISGQFKGFSRSFDDKKIDTKVIRFDIINPTEEIAEKLKIDMQDFVYHIERARYADDEGYVVEYSYMPIEIIPGLRKDVLERSIYDYIENDLGLNIKSAHRTIRASLPTQLEKEYLGITDNTPILEVEQVAYLDNGNAFEYSKSRHRSDKFEFISISIKS